MDKKVTMKSLNFTLEPDVYPVFIDVIFTNDYEERDEFFKKVTGQKDLQTRPPSNGSLHVYENHFLLHFEIKDYSLSQYAGLIAHEATHTSWYIERELGDMFDNNIQEPQCYLIQYLTQNILFKWMEHLEIRLQKYGLLDEGNDAIKKEGN